MSSSTSVATENVKEHPFWLGGAQKLINALKAWADEQGPQL